MPPDTAPANASVAISDVTGIKERTPLQKLIAAQSFWVTIAVGLIVALMSLRYPDQYGTEENFYNITRNFSFIGIMALGMTAVILTGGIDLSVGSVMGVVVITIGVIMHGGGEWLTSAIIAVGLAALVGIGVSRLVIRGDRFRLIGMLAGVAAAVVAVVLIYLVVNAAIQGMPGITSHWIVAVIAGTLAGVYCGLLNGVLITYVGLPSFVVTLGTLQAFRSVAVVLSANKMIYQLGKSADQFFAIFGGQILGIATSVWVLAAMAVIFAWVLHYTTWGRYLYAIGGNEQAAQLTGVPVNRVKLMAFVFAAFCAAVASVLLLGWQGSAINAVGQGYELRVIASTVIGGANLMGGEGGAYGAFIGAALIEVIRNGLLMAGVDSNWQGIFVGAFIVLAVLLERVRGRKRE